MRLPTVTQAFLIHFTLSLVVFCVLVGIMVFSWFPGELFFMEGGWDGLKIIAPIDLVLGPALTLVFYRPWKKNVKFDMSVIVLLQVLALGYGVHAAHGQRTAAIIFAQNRFETVSYTEFKAAQKMSREKGRQPKTIDELGGKMPVLAYATPYTAADFGQYLEEIANGDLELRERSSRYRLLPTLADELDKYQIPYADGGNKEVSEIRASDKSGNPTQTITLPLKARFLNGQLTLNTKTFEITDIKRDG